MTCTYDGTCVRQVTEEIREGTKFHFDYIALLIASSAISAMGLATDNVAVVVAAMLVRGRRGQGDISWRGRADEHDHPGSQSV